MNSQEKLNNQEQNHAPRPEQPAHAPELLGQELAALEARRLLRHPYLENLKRFGRRATALGALLFAAHAAEAGFPSQATAEEQTARRSEQSTEALQKPYFEEWRIVTKGGARFSATEYAALEEGKDEELFEKGKQLRALLEEITTNIGTSEKLNLVKINVIFTLYEEDEIFVRNIVGGTMDGETSELSVWLRSDIDPVQDRKKIEVVVSHELGHFIDDNSGHGEEAYEEAWKHAREENPETGTELKKTEEEIKLKEEKTEGLGTLTAELQEAYRRIGNMSTTTEETKKMKQTVKELSKAVKLSRSIMMAQDQEYARLITEKQKLQEDLAVPFIRFLTQRGGPEIIADFFTAKWAAHEDWAREKLEETLQEVFGDDIEYHELSIHAFGNAVWRRNMVLFQYDRIMQNPNLWLSLPNDKETIKTMIENLTSPILTK